MRYQTDVRYSNKIKDLQQAWQDFDEADPDFIDTAILKIKSIESELSAILKNIKKRADQV